MSFFRLDCAPSSRSLRRTAMTARAMTEAMPAPPTTRLMMAQKGESVMRMRVVAVT
jgi:hypothetical protein